MGTRTCKIGMERRDYSFMAMDNGETHYMCIVSDTFDRACDLLEDIRAEFEANELLKHDFGEQYNPGYWEKGNFVTMNGFICKAFGTGADDVAGAACSKFFILEFFL